MINNEEEGLWRRFQQSDKEAFETIYTRYFPLLYQYGFHLIRNEDLVKDSIQTLFVDLWKSRQRLAQTTSIKFYLLKAIRRQVYLSIRKEARYTPYNTETEEKDGTLSPEFELISRQTTEAQQATLQQAINSLSHRQKEAIILLYIEGRSYPEVSDMMAVKVRTVYNLVHTALEKLRHLLDKPGIWLSCIALMTQLCAVSRVGQ